MVHIPSHTTTQKTPHYMKKEQQCHKYLLLNAILIVFKILLTCTVLNQRLSSHFDPITDVEIRI